MKLKFTWLSFISLLLVVLIISVFKVYGTNIDDKKEKFETEKVVSMKLTPKGCCYINDEWNKLDTHTQETWGLEGNRNTCMMLYGEHCPKTRFGVAGPTWASGTQESAYYV